MTSSSSRRATPIIVEVVISYVRTKQISGEKQLLPNTNWSVMRVWFFLLCRVRPHDEAIDSDGVLHQQLVGRQSRGGGSLAPPLERVLVSQAPPVGASVLDARVFRLFPAAQLPCVEHPQYHLAKIDHQKLLSFGIEYICLPHTFNSKLLIVNAIFGVTRSMTSAYEL